MAELFSRKLKNLIGLQSQSQQLTARKLIERKRIRECSSGVWRENLEADMWSCGATLVNATLSDRDEEDFKGGIATSPLGLNFS